MDVRIENSLKRLLIFLNSNKGVIACLSIIGLLGLISISWFRGQYLISAVDFSMPLDRIKSFIANFYIWDPRSLGVSNPRILAFTFPVWTYFGFSEVLGISVIDAEKILFYSIFTLSGLSMYYLTVTLLAQASLKFRYLAGLVSGIFYMLNPYVAINILPLRQVSYIVYAVFPLILGLFIKGLNERRSFKSAVVVVFALLLATSSFVDPSFVPLTFFPMLLYFLFFLLTNRNKASIFSAFRFVVIGLVLWLLLNAYWLIPDLSFASGELAKVAGAYGNVGSSFQSIIHLNSAPLADSFHLLGFWALDNGFRGDSYFLWASTYQTSLFTLLGLLLPFLAFIPILLKPKNKHVIFFTILAVISLFLANGSSNPLGNWIYNGLPLFGAFFNTPFLRFGMYLTLAYAFLIGYALTAIFSRITFSLKRIRFLARHIISGASIILLLFLIVGVYAFPLLTGDVIRPDTSVLRSNRYQLPSYYQDANEWLGTDSSNFNIIIFPISALGYGELKWANGGYDGPYPAESLFPKTIIHSSSAGNGLAGQATKLIVGNSTVEAAKLLASMNIKYVMFNEDANWAFIENNTSWISCSPKQFQSILNTSGAFTLEKTFGQLDFYKNNYWLPMEVYPASTSILSDGNLNELIQIEGRNYFVPRNSIVVLSNQLVAQQISDLPMTAVFIRNFEKSQPFTAARYYSSWKGVISTNGTGDLGMIIYSSPSKCPYLSAFPMSFTNWSAYDSTLIYVATGSSSLTINSISANGQSAPAEAWWQTGTSWVTGWPITIPPNQNAVIQLNQHASNIMLQTDDGPIALKVTNGYVDPLTNETPSEIPATIVAPNSGDYLLAINVTTGYNYGNLSVKVDDQLLDVNLYSQEPGTVFSYKYLGPIYLSAGSHKITIITKDGALPQIDSMLFCSLNNAGYFVNADNLFSSIPQNTNTSLTFKQINPTKYSVYVNSSRPFYLVFSDSYDKGWTATINGQQISDQYHFTANGYANSWYINKTGTYTITLEFTPQNLFYAGGAISITVLIICTIYISKNKIKNIYQRYLKKNSITIS
jgi:hypothetical protein